MLLEHIAATNYYKYSFYSIIDILSNNLSQYMHMYSFDEATVTAIYKKIRN